MIVGPARVGLGADLPVDAKNLQEAHAAALSRLQAEFEGRRADLYARYASALDPVLRQFMAKGDLDSVLAVREEQDAARRRQALGERSLPEISTHRANLFKALAPLQDANRQSQDRLTADYLKDLGELRTRLTQFGRLDEAVAVDAELKRVKGTAAEPAATAIAGAPTAPAPPGIVRGSPMDSPDIWRGTNTLAPGHYRPRHRIVLGTVDKNDPVRHPLPLVTTQPVTEIDGGSIFIDNGRWNASGTRFISTAIAVDLSGIIEAKGCLFEDCRMGKGGAWFVRWHSAKWVFDNCVFSRQFINLWKMQDIGVKATHCTFHDVELPVVRYREDAGAEALHEWATVKDCRFIGCAVPESFLLVTRDCVFDGCTFGKPEDALPIKTPLKVRAFVARGGSMPRTGPGREIDTQGPDLAPADAGASVRYRRNGKTLRFQ